ncbi:MAG: EF-P lysine aminoacylase GenX [Gammaproteobacteria bacterium]|nr:EF-P lysine aminoacylase GenX [Gammaproteobacteria bacterium]
MDTLFENQSWLPGAGFDVLRLRASVYKKIREFFRQRDVLEVDTPSLSRASVTDPNIQSFETFFQGCGAAPPQRMFLITSPEFHMKRLLAAGSGSIYQICHVFRQSELGTQHNPEFTMLEWYRVGMDYHMLMREVAELVSSLMPRQLDEPEYLTYKDAFQRYAGIDPLAVALDELQRQAQQAGFTLPAADKDNRDIYLDFLMSTVVQPCLGRQQLTFIYEYPASQCALARIAPHNSQVAERFELFLEGNELANGFHELTDARQQLQRFQLEQRWRELRGMPLAAIDHELIAALGAGLPDCSGVALGLDRLILLMSGKKVLSGVLAFPFNLT